MKIGHNKFIPFYLKEKNNFKARNFKDALKEWKEKFSNVNLEKSYKIKRNENTENN